MGIGHIFATKNLPSDQMGVVFGRRGMVWIKDRINSERLMIGILKDCMHAVTR